MTHWVGQEVLAKRKGPGNEFESKGNLTQAHSMDQCALDLITKVVLCHTSLTFE